MAICTCHWALKKASTSTSASKPTATATKVRASRYVWDALIYQIKT
jgi:hypothetical protein